MREIEADRNFQFYGIQNCSVNDAFCVLFISCSGVPVPLFVCFIKIESAQFA